jgi:hypothetical protein
MNFFICKRSHDKRFFKTAFLFLLFVPFHFLCFAQVRPKLSIQLLLNTNPGSENIADGVVAFFDDNFSYSIGNEDSYKWTNEDENLAINCRGTLLSIDGQPGLREKDTLHLAVWQFRQKSYYLKLVASNFSQSVKTVVHDNYLHTKKVVDLSSPALLPFSVSTDKASFAADRFVILFETKKAVHQSTAAKLSSAFKENLSLSVLANPAKSNEINLQMRDMKNGRYTVSLYSDAGEMIYTGFITHDGSAAVKTIVPERRMRKGTYSLLLTLGDETIKKSVLF